MLCSFPVAQVQSLDKSTESIDERCALLKMKTIEWN